jgi:hypothetical protein
VHAAAAAAAAAAALIHCDTWCCMVLLLTRLSCSLAAKHRLLFLQGKRGISFKFF